MGDELGNATDIKSLLGPSGLSTHKKNALIGNDDVWSCHNDLKPKRRQKNVLCIVVFLGILARSSRILIMFGVASRLLCQGQCFPFSSPNLQLIHELRL